MSRRFMWIYTGMCKSPFSFSTLIDKSSSSSSFSSEDAGHSVNLLNHWNILWIVVFVPGMLSFARFCK